MKILALIVVLVLAQCELRSSWMYFADADSCCSTTCCDARGCDEPESDNAGAPDDQIKNCCTTCCYLPASATAVNGFASLSEIPAFSNSSTPSSFSADCFHPPELV